MVGIFYRAPAPGEAPFVELGNRVSVGQTICILEAMKLMNELEAELSGEVVEILVENGTPVEYNQVLMRVRTS
jgi:acetyl-CoA carboxylase biotin carboxyl carrier protein